MKLDYVTRQKLDYLSCVVNDSRIIKITIAAVSRISM